MLGFVSFIDHRYFFYISIIVNIFLVIVQIKQSYQFVELSNSVKYEHRALKSHIIRGVRGPEEFYELIQTKGIFNGTTSDKFSNTHSPHSSHNYGTMYGLFLTNYIDRLNEQGIKTKMFEIGLGCDMLYGPGLSARTWRNMYTPEQVELWYAENKEVCVNQPAMQETL